MIIGAIIQNILYLNKEVLFNDLILLIKNEVVESKKSLVDYINEVEVRT